MSGDAPSVAIVGGGPAGLSAAVELARRGVRDVVVLERERQAGGIPRHAQHQGFGLRDLHRALSGPVYAQRLRAAAESGGTEILEETMVTGWSPDGPLEITSPGGRRSLSPRAVILATGCRERPRPARLVPGSRPRGVMTTGMLQQLVYLKGERAGRDSALGAHALIVGAEHVSFSALMTLAHGGARAVGMATELPRHGSFAAFRTGAWLRYRAPLWTRTALTAIRGRGRVEEVELTELDSGRVRLVPCDTVVFTADWIPDNELALLGGLEMDAGTGGPAVDPALRCSRRGVFAAGNLLHGAETADVAGLSGRHAAASAARFAAGGDADWPGRRVEIACEPPLAWISPNAVAGAAPQDAPAGAATPPRGRFLLRSSELLARPGIDITQDGRALWHGRLAHLAPGRSARLPHAWTAGVDPEGGPVRVSVRFARRR